MAGYVMVQVKEITDPARFKEYGERTSVTVEQYGGRYLVRGGAYEQVEGDWPDCRNVVIEFPSVERAKQWYESPEYAPLIAMRQAASESQMIRIEGYDG